MILNQIDKKNKKKTSYEAVFRHYGGLWKEISVSGYKRTAWSVAPSGLVVGLHIISQNYCHRNINMRSIHIAENCLNWRLYSVLVAEVGIQWL